MSERKKKILAYVALGFMAVFSVFLVIFFINPVMWNGGVAFIVLFSGVCGIGLHFYIKQNSKKDTTYLPEGEDEPDDIESDLAEFDALAENVDANTAENTGIDTVGNVDANTAKNNGGDSATDKHADKDSNATANGNGDANG